MGNNRPEGPARAVRELEALILRHGAIIRAVPTETKSVYEISHAAEHPGGQIKYLPEYGREMLVVWRRHAAGGQFLLKTSESAGATVKFTMHDAYGSLEDVLGALRRLDGAREKTPKK